MAVRVGDTLKPMNDQDFPVVDATDVSGLATVARTGDYNDLTNKPSIPTLQPAGSYSLPVYIDSQNHAQPIEQLAFSYNDITYAGGYYLYDGDVTIEGNKCIYDIDIGQSVHHITSQIVSSSEYGVTGQLVFDYYLENDTYELSYNLGVFENIESITTNSDKTQLIITLPEGFDFPADVISPDSMYANYNYAMFYTFTTSYLTVSSTGINKNGVQVSWEGHTHNANQITGLANVATSGDYNDLINKPSGGLPDPVGNNYILESSGGTWQQQQNITLQDNSQIAGTSLNAESPYHVVEHEISFYYLPWVANGYNGIATTNQDVNIFEFIPYTTNYWHRIVIGENSYMFNTENKSWYIWKDVFPSWTGEDGVAEFYDVYNPDTFELIPYIKFYNKDDKYILVIDYTAMGATIDSNGMPSIFTSVDDKIYLGEQFEYVPPTVQTGKLVSSECNITYGKFTGYKQGDTIDVQMSTEPTYGGAHRSQNLNDLGATPYYTLEVIIDEGYVDVTSIYWYYGDSYRTITTDIEGARDYLPINSDAVIVSNSDHTETYLYITPKLYAKSKNSLKVIVSPQYEPSIELLDGAMKNNDNIIKLPNKSGIIALKSDIEGGSDINPATKTDAGIVRLANDTESSYDTASDGADGLAVMSPTQVKAMIQEALSKEESGTIRLASGIGV